MEGPKKVLVVDDEEGIRAGIERILSKRGFDVHLAESGEQALEMLGRENFLVKPFTPSDLMEVMDRAVKQRKLIIEREAYRSDKKIFAKITFLLYSILR